MYYLSNVSYPFDIKNNYSTKPRKEDVGQECSRHQTAVATTVDQL